MLQLNPARALPAHGPVIEDPAALIEHYLAHRAQREEQVLDLLAAGTSTVDGLTAKIYPSISADLLAMARESVLAHLMKLELEGRASARDGDAGSIARLQYASASGRRGHGSAARGSGIRDQASETLWIKSSTSSTSIATATSTR